MVGEQVKLKMAIQKIELPVDARQPAVEEALVIAIAGDERVSVNPVHDAQRKWVSVPTVAASHPRLLDPALDQRLATTPRLPVASLKEGPRARDGEVEVVKMIVPQMTFITPVPVNSVERQRPVEKREPVLGQTDQSLIVFLQRRVQVDEQFFKDFPERPDSLSGGLRRFSVFLCPLRRQSRPGL